MALIELLNIEKTYHLGEIDVPVLRGITLAIDGGELVSLMGSSGSGKTTLMNILGCLDRPSTGDYRLDGIEVSTLSSDERAAIRNTKIGFVFQSFNLLPRTSALENVIMPLSYSPEKISRTQARERGEEILVRMGFVHLLTKISALGTASPDSSTTRPTTQTDASGSAMTPSAIAARVASSIGSRLYLMIARS